MLSDSYTNIYLRDTEYKSTLRYIDFWRFLQLKMVSS